YSDPSNKPSSAENVTDDLHALLRAAGINGRIVLIGHSLGGLFATLYADKFEGDLSGLVLVDPVFAGKFHVSVAPQDNAIMLRELDDWVSATRSCEKVADEGKLSPSNPQHCMPSSQVLQDQKLTPAEAEYLTQQFYRPSYYPSLLSEYENSLSKEWMGRTAESIDGLQEARRARSFGNLPLEVLTAGIPAHDPKVSDATNGAIRHVWISGHDKLAKRSTVGESIVIQNSHHFIQMEQPDAVVAAIRKVVSEARQP
ncbi:MAG: alpha/beta fold hydrolase, partial [Limisphaerales bacterium]